MTDITWTNDTRKLSDLVPWEHNPKRMTKKQAEGLRLSIERFGFAVPFLVSPDGDIYDGHQRQALMGAIKQYGPDAVVDVRVSSRPLDDDERRELVVRLKQNQAGWDFDMLPNLYEREELLEWGFEPEELGMFADEPQGEDPGPRTDKAAELQAKWQVESGQLWALGEHRLICGDCTDAAVVARVMDGERAALVFSDPPYNYASENGIYGADVSKAMAGLKAAKWDQDFDLRPALDVLPLAKDVTVYLCSSHHLAPVIWAWMKTWADHFSWCVWNKPNPMPSLAKRHWTWNAELVPYATRGKHVFNFPANGHAFCVWTIDKAKETDHPTEKPVAVPEHAIMHSSAAGDLVFDGFLGSGTTLIACERLGRRCRAVEIEPGYVAVALERWATMTGRTPTLLDGAS